MPSAAFTEPLRPAQRTLIRLLTFIQVARDRCGFVIDVDVLRQAAGDAGIDFRTAEQQAVRNLGFAEAEHMFRAGRERLECAYAPERFGPDGSELKGLIERRPDEFRS